MNSTDLQASLRIGDTITYRCAISSACADDVRPAWNGPYVGIVVGVGRYSVEVRSDGWGGVQTLYRPFYCDILSVNGTPCHQYDDSTEQFL